MLHNDEYYMRQALAHAERAANEDEVPVGAIVVDAAGYIIGAGHNEVEGRKVQTAHAEVAAIEQAADHIGDWRLDGCTIFVTLEPCRMCMGLLQLSRISRIVYAIESPRFGYRLDNEAISSVYKKDIQVEKGICADKAQRILQQFFQQKRKKKDECTQERSGCSRERTDTTTE